MAQVPMDSFEEGTELVRVYLAASLAEAQQIEVALEEGDVEFAIEVEELAVRNVLGGSQPRRCAGFWVREAALDAAATLLERGGHVAGLVRR